MISFRFNLRALSVAPLLLAILLLAEPAHSQGQLYSAEDFGATLGRAQRNNAILGGFHGGLANELWAYSLSYVAVGDNGRSAWVFPLTLWQDAAEPTTLKGNLDRISSPRNRLLGLGVKYRQFALEGIDEGVFAGGGMRAWFVQSQYTRTESVTGAQPFEFIYFDLLPLMEAGYVHRLTGEFTAEGSLELGWAFSSFDNSYNELAQSDGTPPQNDPDREAAYGGSGAFWSVNLLFGWYF